MKLGWIGLIGLGVWGFLAAVDGVGSGSQESSSAGRVLIVADERPAMEALARFLQSNHFHTEIVEQSAMPRDLAFCATVIMYIHGPMTASAETAMVEYAKSGGRLLILHHGLASARVNNPAWLEMNGIYIAARNAAESPWKVVPNTTFTLVNLYPGHYITRHNVEYNRRVSYRSSDAPSQPRTFDAIDFKDTEVFLNQQFTDGRKKTVLFGFTCTDPQTGQTHSQDRGGWYKRAGKGWVFYFQPGHTVADFENRAYRQIILNSLIWKPAGPDEE